MNELMERICKLCQTIRFQGTREKELQAALETLLRANFSAVAREVKLAPGAIVDFLVEGVALEVKIDGSPMEVTRQLHRYAQSELVQALILVTTRAKHRTGPSELNGKPVLVVWLSPF